MNLEKINELIDLYMDSMIEDAKNNPEGLKETVRILCQQVERVTRNQATEKIYELANAVHNMNKE